MPEVTFDQPAHHCRCGGRCPAARRRAAHGCASPRLCLEIVAGIVLGPTGSAGCTSTCRCRSWPCSGWRSCCSWPGWRSTSRRCAAGRWRSRRAATSITLALGVAVGGALHAAGWVQQPFLIAVALSATSLGLVVPVLKDAGETVSAVGQAAIVRPTRRGLRRHRAPVVLLLCLRRQHRRRVVLLVVFALLVVVTGVVVSSAGRSMRVGELLVRLQDTTAEIRVRLAVVLLVAFVALASSSGWNRSSARSSPAPWSSMVDRDAASHPHFRTKLEAIGYGFVVPVFFVSSGIRLDLTRPDAQSKRAGPGTDLLRRAADRAGCAGAAEPARDRRTSDGCRRPAAGHLAAVSRHRHARSGSVLGKISGVTAAAVVCAGLLSVLRVPADCVGPVEARSGRARLEPRTRPGTRS